MRLLTAISLLALTCSWSAQAAEIKEWTYLTFLNGHNNLDPFGAIDINEAEKVGSTDQINIVFQWASLASKTTKRLLITKDSDPTLVTSPVIQELPRVDMGDWRALADFIQWGAENFPAKRYFVSVWNHGTGWHKFKLSGVINPSDISLDDLTGNYITTRQLGEAMRVASEALGRKIDLYGSDACLMAMAEVASEMSDSVDFFVGSQELEPGRGWPYDQFLSAWAKKPELTPPEVAKLLAQEYFKSYQGGTQGTAEVTFSAFDLSKINTLHSAVGALSQKIQTLSSADRDKVILAAKNTLNFFYEDYRDLGEFARRTKALSVHRDLKTAATAVENAVKSFVITAQNSSAYSAASGVSFWLPTEKYSYDSYKSAYSELRFQEKTSWSEAAKTLVK
jgi:hypothetical protein